MRLPALPALCILYIYVTDRAFVKVFTGFGGDVHSDDVSSR